ncbi:MAG: hypothetical protein JNM27_22320 [Leptospirales bacterium]|nr:hypothetical protein [Leptospirales bacterium]
MALLLKENFISFPGAEDFPVGPYDLDKLTYAIHDDGAFELGIQLGWVYDIYLLRIVAGETTAWELWHQDSAVIHVDERKIADNPPLRYEEFSTPCNIPLKIAVMKKTLESRAIRLTFRPAVPAISFAIEFELESGPAACLTALGWRMMNDTPSDDSWPSDEWKDWNTM